MRKRGYATGFIIGVAALACLPFRHQMSAGLLLGFGFSLLYIRFLIFRVDNMIARERVGVVGYLGLFLSLALLGCPFVIALSHPAQFDWVGVLIGLLAFKAALYLEAFLGGSHDM